MTLKSLVTGVAAAAPAEPMAEKKPRAPRSRAKPEAGEPAAEQD